MAQTDIMDQKHQLPFKKGQKGEARSFALGFRGAWFRYKIQEIRCRSGDWIAHLQYFDYPDEKWTWTDLYQVPPYQSRKPKEIGQLMLRPEYPSIIHLNSNVSDVSSNFDVTVVVERTWKEGDLVDWCNNDCYWSGKVTKLLDNDKAEIELLPPPLGEGATYEVFVKDIRPSLDWSLESGWALPASLDGESSCQDSPLLKLVSQAMLPPKKRGYFRSTSSILSPRGSSPHLSCLRLRNSSFELQPGQKDNLGRLMIMPKPNGSGFYPEEESADALKKSITKLYDMPYPTWGEIPAEKRQNMFNRFKTFCTWLPKYDKIIFKIYRRKSSSRMSDWFYGARKHKKKPDWLLPHLYTGLQAYWRTEEFLAKSKKAKEARQKGPRSKLGVQRAEGR